MALTKKQLIGVCAGLGLALVLGVAWPRLGPALRVRLEERRWKPWLSETFQGGKSTHAQSWDDLVYPLEQGGFAPRAWGHFTLKGLPHQAFRIRAWFRVAKPEQSAWLKLIAASPVEYYDLTNGVGTGLPRTRFAGSFGRLELSGEQATLSTGQENLQGQLLNASAQPLTQSVGTGETLLEWTSRGERLQVKALGQEAQSLARELFTNRTPEIKIGLAGENVIFSRIEVATLKDPGAIAQEQVADDYFVVGKAHMAEPIYAELAQNAEDSADQGRYQLREAQALALQGKRDEAQELLKALIGREPKGLYGGYARMDLIALMEQTGKPAAELGAALSAFYNGEPEHPLASAARMRHARLLGQDKVQLPMAQKIALEALGGSDPSAAAEALDFLGNSPTALAPQELLLKLQDIRRSRLGQSVGLAEAVSLKQASLQGSLKDWAGLGATLTDALRLPNTSRSKLFVVAENALYQVPEMTGSQLWQALALQGKPGVYLLLNYLSLRGYGHYRGGEKQASYPWPLLAASDAIRSQVKLADAPAATDERAFADLQGPPPAVSYGHLPQQGPTLQNGELCLLYKSGDYWGCGIAIPPNVAPLLADGQIDLSGYTHMQLELWAPKGTEVFLSLSEDGVADPKSERFDGLAGADGEQYLFPSVVGNGEWQTLTLPLHDLAPAPNWGNPRGNLTVDLQAVKKLDVAIPGKQGVGRVCVRKLRFSVE